MSAEPVDIRARLSDPATYDEAILRIFIKRNARGLGFAQAAAGVTYFAAAL